MITGVVTLSDVIPEFETHLSTPNQTQREIPLMSNVTTVNVLLTTHTDTPIEQVVQGESGRWLVNAEDAAAATTLRVWDDTHRLVATAPIQTVEYVDGRNTFRFNAEDVKLEFWSERPSFPQHAVITE